MNIYSCSVSVKNKNKRIAEIRSIITQQKIGGQEELLQILTAKGYALTQATLSRDLKQMKVVKTPNKNGEYIYVMPSNVGIVEAHPSILSTAAVSIDFSGNILVLHTRPGYASSMAYKLDDEAKDVIIGTVAGEDTIICIIKEGIIRKQVLEKLYELFPTLRP